MSTRRGFSFLEVAIALMLLAFIFVPIFEVLRNSVKGTTQSLHLTRAFQMARTVVDLAESFSYEELSDDGLKRAVARLDVPAGVEPPVLDEIRAYSRNSGSSWLEAKIVTVRVGWARAEGRERGEVVLHALVLRSR